MVVDERFERAVVVDSPTASPREECGATMAGPALFGNVLESSAAQIAIEDAAILEVNVDALLLHLGKGMAIYQKQVFPSVVVEIEKGASPADESGIARHAGRNGGVVEFALPRLR